MQPKSLRKATYLRSRHLMNPRSLVTISRKPWKHSLYLILLFLDPFFLFKPHSALWKALFVAYGGPYAVAAGLKITHDLLAFLQPQLLRWFLSYISAYQETRFNATERPSKSEGFLIALLMFVASVVQTIFLNQVSDVILLCFGNYLFIPLIVFYTYVRDWNARSSWSRCCNLFESSRPF